MIHVQTWRGTGSVRITDMNNAGKRGKTCSVIRFNGWFNPSSDGVAKQASDLTAQITLWWAPKLTPETSFDVAANELTKLVAQSGLPDTTVQITLEQIRGVDAPRTKLTAGLPNKWAATADENGVSISDLTDRSNEPRMITRHGQKNSRAYELAAKVWDRVQAAESFHEVGEILRLAGCRLHYYCAMD